MRAAYYEANGPAIDVLKVAEVETPKPGPGEVRVKIAASGVNPSDVKTRAGTMRKIAFPRVIPHSDGAGTIDAIGDGVNKARLGERVWIWNGAWKRPFGTAAEFIVLPEGQAVALPGTVSFDDGACLGIPALTAYHAVTLDGSVKGQTILVHAGAGAVGHYVVQIAKAKGATVIATISSPEKAAPARAGGADHTINYKSEDIAARVKEMTGGKGVDRIVDMDITANAKLIPAVLKPRGTVVIYGIGGPEATIPAQYCLTSQIQLKFFLVYDLDDAARTAALADLTAMLKAGQLKHTVAAAYPLDQIVAAHQAVESGKAMGNVIVRP
jgi:NADPH2:quinone reductase